MGTWGRFEVIEKLLNENIFILLCEVRPPLTTYHNAGI